MNRDIAKRLALLEEGCRESHASGPADMKALMEAHGWECPEAIDGETSQEYFKRVPTDTLRALLDMSDKEISSEI